MHPLNALNIREMLHVRSTYLIGDMMDVKKLSPMTQVSGVTKFLNYADAERNACVKFKSASVTYVAEK